MKANRDLAMEGRPYSCEWKKIGVKYLLWVMGSPDISVESRDFDECRYLLAEEISKRFKDIDPVLEFLSYPDYIIPHQYAHPSYVWLGRNTPAHLASPIEAIYEGGYCSVCLWPRGERTGNPIKVESIPSDADCLNVSRLDVAIYSQRVIDAIGLPESHQYFLVPVQVQKPSSARLFEVRAAVSEVVLSPVAVKGVSAEKRAWRCSECSASGIHYDNGSDLIEFVSATAVRRLADDFFLFRGRLCASRKKWMKVTSRLKLHDVYARPLGIARDEDIDLDASFDVIRPSKKRSPFAPRK